MEGQEEKLAHNNSVITEFISTVKAKKFDDEAFGEFMRIMTGPNKEGGPEMILEMETYIQKYNL